MEKVELTAKALELFKVLKANEGADFTAADIAAEMNENGGNPVFGPEVTARQISGAMTALSNKGLAMRVKDVVEVEGKKKTVTYLHLTDEGKATEAVLKVEEPKKPRGKKAEATDEVAE